MQTKPGPTKLLFLYLFISRLGAGEPGKRLHINVHSYLYTYIPPPIFHPISRPHILYFINPSSTPLPVSHTALDI